MLFNSHVFLFAFLPLALLVYFGLGHRGHTRGALFSLMAASLVFYGWWSAGYVLLLVASLSFDYLLGARIARLAAVDKPRARRLLIVGLTIDLGLLAYFKYSGFLVENVQALLGTHWHYTPPVLPLAISFYTFQQVAYLVDCYRTAEREPSPLRYGLFVTFFPHEIAGPLVNHREMLPQFAEPDVARARTERITVGLICFFRGLFKKVAVADVVAQFANPVFAAAGRGEAIGLVDGWVGAVAYSLQLYFDFSGYSDMAIGLAWMFNIRLPLNFDTPYRSASIVEFWRRWHISLSRFLRDYLYVALGGNRKGRVRRYVNLMLTMVLGGLWHGAGWNFLLWGALHGSYLVLTHAWTAARERLDLAPLGQEGRWTRPLSIAATYVAVVVAWVFFRAETLDGALGVLKGMAGLSSHASSGLAFRAVWNDDLSSFFRAATKTAILFAALPVVFLSTGLHRWMGPYNPALIGESAQPLPAIRWGWQPSPGQVLACAAMAAVAILRLSEVSEFIYYNF
ncbi:MBOAT family O-acyltransferase [Hyalangium rubrum]|uniref:MBOAT family O-acyltransferase n=1 Tax=Hyalangium rubrum TaxID=3103134 RepID=A0ABU5GYE0_9BACT|nr:MBOAT family O-acyltransferase [Hyalangium sp. s54d21]MDY7226220.1 MBOAT family O-acyltransferase [Hyalangium sp. s54d21]